MQTDYKSTAASRMERKKQLLASEYGHRKYRQLTEEQRIVLLTESINVMNKHVNKFYQDQKNKHSLQIQVARRFRLLTNMRYDDFPRYARLITRLSLPDTFHERSFPMVDPVGTNVKGLTSSKASTSDDAAPGADVSSQAGGGLAEQAGGDVAQGDAAGVVQGGVYSLLEARLKKFHEEKVYEREQALAVARIQQIEHFYMKMLQDKVWRDLRLDHPLPEKPDVAFMPDIRTWWASKQRMVQSPEELRKRAANEPAKITKRWQRILKPWRVDGTRKGFRAQKIHFNRHIFDYLRRWAPLFYESKMYRTTDWRESPFWQGAPAPYLLKYLGKEAKQVMKERQWRIETGVYKRPHKRQRPTASNWVKVQKFRG